MSPRSGSDVVVTGLGVVSPIGGDRESFWRALLGGVVGTAELTRFDTTGLDASKGGEISAEYQDRERSMPRAQAFACAAAREAVRDAGVSATTVDRARVGVCFGTVMGTRPAIESWIRGGAEGDGWLDPSALSRAPALEFGFCGPNAVIPTACAAGNSAISYGVAAIRDGSADAMVVGGADELSLAMLMMFNSFHALAPDAVRPFDLHRRGLMLGEGAAALVIESEAHAAARGVRPYGRVLGYGNFADAYHMTAPHPDGRGAVRSMTAALQMADLTPDDVDYVSAHGTGTPSNDPVEASALRRVMGPATDSIGVSSIKSMLGHMQGAAGAVEAASCLLAIRDGIVPPTMNYDTPDPACALDIVANAPRGCTVEVALNNAFGFGGNIECVAFGRP
jgi:3-oxoacyl-(acyl-carrier-protein) synthase